MLTWQLWCILAGVLWIYYLWSRRRFYLLTLQLPGPLGFPILGMAHKLARRDRVLLEFGGYLEKLGPILFSWLGPLPFLIVADPQLIQDILTSPHCVNKGVIYKAIDDGVGSGLFSMPDPGWSIHRKFLNPAFGRQVLLSFLPIFNTETASLLKTMDTLVDGNGKDLMSVLQNFTLCVATQTTMGTDVRELENVKNKQLLGDYQRVLETMTDIAFSPWLFSKKIRELLGKEEQYSKSLSEINGFIRKLIQQKLSERSTKDNNSSTQDKNLVVNIALNLMDRQIFSMKNVEDESNVILFGAFETTANTVAYTLILLSMFPEYQEKAFEEIVELFPIAGDFEVTYEDTTRLVYLDRILSESMRVMAPVPIVSRQTMDDVRLSNGVVIPKGVQIAIDIFHLHRSKKIWGDDAETFNPEHMTQERHPYAFIPFTKGIRNCIGWRYALLSAKVTLAKLIRNYRFSTSFKFEDLYFVEDVTIKLKTVPLLEIQRRI